MVRIQKKQQQQKTTGLLSEKQGLERRPQSCGITCEFLKRITDEQRKTKAQRSEMISVPSQVTYYQIPNMNPDT